MNVGWYGKANPERLILTWADIRGLLRKEGIGHEAENIFDAVDFCNRNTGSVMRHRHITDAPDLHADIRRSGRAALDAQALCGFVADAGLKGQLLITRADQRKLAAVRSG